jgi:hypothetical protein
MRVALALSLFLVARGSSESAGSPPSALRSSGPSVAPAAAATCQSTTTRDATGVITANGLIGVLGDTSTRSATAMNEPLLLVRRGTVEGDRIALRFENVGRFAPATWVDYGVVAHPVPSPWGAFTFEAGWKPIGFAGSCWLLVVVGVASGLVLEVRP